MAKTPDHFYLPRWNRRASGLILPSSVSGWEIPPEARVEVPEELMPKPSPIALGQRPPTSLDQMATFADEDALGLKVSSVAELREPLARVPFDMALRLAALITAKVHAAPQDVDFQLAMARDLYGENSELVRRILKFVHEEEHAVVFAEQNCMILERLLVEDAADADPNRPLTKAEYDIVVAAAIGTSAITGMVADGATRAVKTSEDFLAFFIQNGAYNSRRAPVGEISRAIELFERLAARPELQIAGCSIDEWAMEDYGFTIGEQLTLGFALSAPTHCWDSDPRTEFKIHMSPEHLDDLLLKLGFLDRRRQALELVSATRAELQAEFAESGDDPAHLAWETRPFMRHPFVRTADEGLILVSPRAMQAWLTDGIHYRLLTSAQKRSGGEGKPSRLYTKFAGGLQEAYALEEMQSVLPGERPVGAGRVYGEQRYGRKGTKKTSDVAVDLGQDLVLIEVSNRRLRADSLIIGDTARVEEEIDKAILTKVKQLDGCIEALIASEATIPDVDMSNVRQIWPVLVTAAEITQTEELWEFVATKAVGEDGRPFLNQAKVQPLALLDVEDYEQLLGHVERGHALHDLLARKTQPAYRHLELAVWLRSDPSSPGDGRPPKMVDDAFHRTTARLARSVNFGKGIQPEVADERPAPERAEPGDRAGA